MLLYNCKAVRRIPFICALDRSLDQQRGSRPSLGCESAACCPLCAGRCPPHMPVAMRSPQCQSQGGEERAQKRRGQPTGTVTPATLTGTVGHGSTIAPRPVIRVKRLSRSDIHSLRSATQPEANTEAMQHSSDAESNGHCSAINQLADCHCHCHCARLCLSWSTWCLRPSPRRRLPVSNHSPSSTHSS